MDQFDLSLKNTTEADYPALGVPLRRSMCKKRVFTLLLTIPMGVAYPGRLVPSTIDPEGFGFEKRQG